MYDCESDRYTEFSYEFTGAQRPAKHCLQGELTARPISGQQAQPAFDALEALARRHGYQVQRSDAWLKVSGVQLADALNFNACFGEQLVIDCQLQRALPVRFAV